MKIESLHYEVKKSTANVFDFLSDPHNLYHLLPHDKISDWQADQTSCSFKVQGGILIPFILESSDKPNSIRYISGDRSPFPFTLDVNLNGKDEITFGNLVFEGKVPFVFQMMAKKPLTDLFNTMSEKLVNYFDQEK